MTSRRPETGSAPRWPVLVLPLALMIVVALAGLRGELHGLRWDGPLHGDPVAVGVVLEAILAIMLVIAARRLVGRAYAGPVTAAASAVAVKLRWVLVVVLSTAMIAVAATMVVGLHRHVFSHPAGARPGRAAAGAAPAASQATHPGWHFAFPALHLHGPAVLLYGLLVLVFAGLVAVRIWWARQPREARTLRAYRYIAKDSPDLLVAVESGRSALYAIDEARAAIIACYVAMEISLAEHGAARGIADTPDELLRRATASGIVRGTAAGWLTALFYEARFSSHRLDRGHRDAAGRALGELAAMLAEAKTISGHGRQGHAKRRGART